VKPEIIKRETDYFEKLLGKKKKRKKENQVTNKGTGIKLLTNNTGFLRQLKNIFKTGKI
jgi:hypothetical protein